MRRIVPKSSLSNSAGRRALHLRLERIREKIAEVEAEIAAIESGQDPEAIAQKDTPNDSGGYRPSLDAGRVDEFGGY